jgi:hypothetical protein
MEWDAGAIMKIAIGAFFVLSGLGVVFALCRLATVFKRLSGILRDTNTKVIPLLTRFENTLDGVNAELGKVDQITGSFAEIVKTAEHTTTAVHGAVTKPMKRAAGLAAALRGGVKSFFTGKGKEN